MPSQDGKDILQEWHESAPYWAKHATVIRSMFAPITTALINATAIHHGQSVLDVAGGSGEPSLTIAEKLRPRGSVVYTDAVRKMVLTSRSDASHRGLGNIQFSQCAAEALPFHTDAFDVVVCRLGVMLFADPPAAIREVIRVVKPSGRIAFAVWHKRDSNPFFQVVAEVVSRYVESPPEEPDAPGAFRFAEHGKLANLLVEAGAIDVTSSLLEFSLEAPLTPRQYWELRTELSDTLRAKLAALSPEQITSMSREVEQAANTFYEAGRMRFPAEVLIVSGAKQPG